MCRPARRRVWVGAREVEQALCGGRSVRTPVQRDRTRELVIEARALLIRRGVEHTAERVTHERLMESRSARHVGVVTRERLGACFV